MFNPADFDLVLARVHYDLRVHTSLNHKGNYLLRIFQNCTSVKELLNVNVDPNVLFSLFAFNYNSSGIVVQIFVWSYELTVHFLFSIVLGEQMVKVLMGIPGRKQWFEVALPIEFSSLLEALSVLFFGAKNHTISRNHLAVFDFENVARLDVT